MDGCILYSMHIHCHTVYNFSTNNKIFLIFLQIISFNNQEVSSHEKQKKESTATPKCAQKKGPHTVLSSNGKYEALKNLNGSFRETKSSEKTNTPFLTPMRTKRMRSG